MNKVGEFSITGDAYVDIVSILGRNGYATEVFTGNHPITQNQQNVEHVVRVFKDIKEEEI